ncbi:hypothetical protein Glove_138g31 [Diversispora epigaea]|uniref:Uncharacterized protein n=1 Tax=Diversispora epigaea TaxID=1348612 RepID=A0A397IW95_9GLOM|nr:hypothetical protein Glove_138g31 [Diversispora epigaea]
MKMKNNRLCSIKNCTYTNTKFRLITKLVYEKCYEKQMLQIFPYLEVGKQLCHPHYYCVNLELNPAKFKNMIENACSQLNGFFNYLVNTIIPKEYSAYNKNEAKKLIVGLCYLIAGLRNKFVNQHKLEVDLYLMASVVTDWPGQIFIRKALYTQLPLEFQLFYLQIKSFIPIMDPLHLSLNSREQVVLIKIKDQIMKKFGKTYKDIEYQITIDLLENLIPFILDIYAILFRTANTLANATVENIIKQAYVIKKSKPKLNKKTKYPKTYILVTLGEEVNLRRLPTGYSTSFLSQNGLCDCCKFPINETNEKGLDVFTQEDLNNENNTEEEEKQYDKKGLDVFTQEDLNNENNTEEEEKQYDKIEEDSDENNENNIDDNWFVEENERFQRLQKLDLT